MLGSGNGMTMLGPVQIRLTGVVRSDANGKDIPSISAPTAAEAEAALNRLARVNGADGVVRVGSDYHRAAIASTPLSTQTFVEVQAWGTAVAHAEARAETPPEA